MVDEGLSSRSTLRFFPLASRRDGDEWIVGRAPAGPFIAIPGVGVEAIELLSAGHTVGEAEQELQRRYREAVDVRRFVGTLTRLGLIADIDGRPTGHRSGRAPGLGLTWLRQEHVAWLATWPVVVAWSGIVGAAAVALALHPATRPGLRDLVWSQSTALVMLTDAVIISFAILLHELAHLSLARAFGVPGSITLSTRLVVVVAQTDVTGAWSLPRRSRLLIYLAGIGCDVCVASLCVIATLALDSGGTVATALRATEIAVGSGILLQFCFYLRTDVYFVLQDLARCRNLNGDAMSVIRYWEYRLRGRGNSADPRRRLRAHERRIVTVYAPLMLVGYLATLVTFSVVSVPLLIRLLTASVTEVAHGFHAHRTPEVVDGAAGLLVLLWVDGTLLVLLARKGMRTVAKRRAAHLVSD